jgi:hypothetical protein
LRTAETDVDPVEQAQALREVSKNGSQRQTNVVTRQAVGMTLPIESSHHPVKDGRKPVLVLVISTDRHLRVVRGDRLVDGTSKSKRQRPCLMASMLPHHTL